MAHIEFTDLFLSSVQTTLIMPRSGKWELFYISGGKRCCAIWDIIGALKPLIPGFQCEPELQVLSRFCQEVFFGCWEMLQIGIKPIGKEVSLAARPRI